MKVLVVVLSLISTGLAQDDEINPRRFPEGFLIGVANAAPQIEGAWEEDGKGETIWDHFSKTRPEAIIDRSTPAVACDSYHKYKEDVAMVKAMGLDHYRLSIAWSRILPTGFTDKVNQAGVQYYKNLFAELRANNIQPLVTLYHWDLPQPLEEQYGGWLNETMSDLFAAYARLCFELFQDDAKLWITINEPKQVCQAGYGSGGFAPGVHSPGVGDYICARNVLLAHAKAFHIYDAEFRATNQGKVAIVVDTTWFEPASDSEADLAAQDRALHFNLGLYGNPVFLRNWPQVVIDRVAERSAQEGFSASRLPPFSEEEIEYISGTFDYLALNHYSTNMINATADAPVGEPSFDKDISVYLWKKPEWPSGSADWFAVVPYGLRHLLAWIKKTYGDIEIIITENGLSDTTGIMEDDHRISYYEGYLSACLDAIYKDKVNLKGYTAWSIMDDWEWTGGYTSFLGMYYVNFTDPERARIPRKSAAWFTNMVAKRCLVDVCTDA